MGGSDVEQIHHGDVADLLDLYGVSGTERETLIRLAREARRRGWWHGYADVLAEGFDTYVDLEIQASLIRTYEAQLVPGLLQTEASRSRIARLCTWRPIQVACIWNRQPRLIATCSFLITFVRLL